MKTFVWRNISLFVGLFMLTLATFGQYPPQHAQAGSSGVYLNGYELSSYDVYAFQQVIGDIEPGQYYFDYNGNFGKVGSAPMVNLFEVYAQYMQQNVSQQQMYNQQAYQNYQNGQWQSDNQGGAYRQLPGRINAFEYNNGQRTEHYNPALRNAVNGSSIMLNNKVLSYPTGVNIP